MGLLKTFFSRDRGEKGLSISLEPGGFVTEVRSYRRPLLGEGDTARLQQTITENEIVFACLRAKKKAAQDPRLIVKKARTVKGKTLYEEQPGHPLRQLIMRPNPQMTEADLMTAAIVSWDMSNPRRFYCEKVYRNGLLVELWPLNPARMTPRRSRQDNDTIVGYTYRDGTYTREYDLDELLIRSAPAWYDPSPGVAALGQVGLDTAQTDYVRAFFENGGVPSGFLKYKTGKLSQPQRDEIRDKWRSTYSNRYGRQHDVGVLDSEVDWQEMGASLDKLQSQVMRSISESRACMVFDVPPLIIYAYVGLLRSTYSNLKEAWAAFWDATMSPTFKEWRDWFTWALLTEFEEERDIRAERVILAHDFSQVAAYQEDVDAAHKRARENFSAGGINQNEFRAAIGYDAIPGGDVFIVRGPRGGDTGADLQPAPAKAQPGAARGRKDRDAPSVQTQERRIERAVKTYLTGEYRKAAQAAEAGTLDQLELDLGDEVATIMERYYPLIVQDAFERATDEAGISVAFDLANEDVQQVLGTLARDIRSVADTTRDEIQRLVGKSAELGWSNTDLARELRRLSDMWSPVRATMIARTESGTAYNRAAILGYRAAGVTQVIVMDGDDDEPCKSANGSTWTLEQAEAAPLGHPNCVRAFRAVVEG